MTIPSIITADEFKTYRDVGNKVDTDKIEDIIRITQSTDLFKLLGNFLFDVLNNLVEPTYEDLLEGSEFTDENGNTLIQEGLKRLVSDLAYARYLYLVNVNFTPFGATVKTSDSSEPVERNILRDISKQTQIDANIKWELIKSYLDSNKDTFPVWKTYCDGKGYNSSNSQRFSIIK